MGLTPIVTADGTNYATLTIGGKSVPVSDVTWRFADESTEVRGRPIDLPTSMRIVITNVCEASPEFEAWCRLFLRTPRKPWRRGANHPGEAPRWYRLRTKRHKKAAAKRTKTRAARYAARWEQAHLRGGK